MKRIPEMSEQELRQLVSENYTYTDVYRKCGYKKTNNHTTLKRYIELYGIDISHFNPRANNNISGLQKNQFVARPLEEILVKDSTYNNTNHLKNRLIKEGLLEYECVICSNKGEWMGLPLVLQLDHIDGDRTNNEITNLRILCPNCHSQTDTYVNKSR